jgi:hypothetical protein
LEQQMRTLADVVTQRTQASVHSEPPLSSVGKALQARRLPNLATYDRSTKQTRYDFLKAVEAMLLSGITATEGIAMLTPMMGVDGRRFLSSKGVRVATSATELFGQLMLEAEQVVDEGELRSRIFGAERGRNEKLLPFMERVDERHQLYAAAFPLSNHDPLMVLNCCRQAVRDSECGLRWPLRGATTLMDAREIVSQIRMPETEGTHILNVSPAGVGDPQMQVLQVQMAELFKTNAPMVALQAQVTELVQAKQAKERNPQWTCYCCDQKGHKIADCPLLIAYKADVALKAADAVPLGNPGQDQKQPDFP